SELIGQRVHRALGQLVPVQPGDRYRTLIVGGLIPLGQVGPDFGHAEDGSQPFGALKPRIVSKRVPTEDDLVVRDAARLSFAGADLGAPLRFHVDERDSRVIYPGIQLRATPTLPRVGMKNTRPLIDGGSNCGDIKTGTFVQPL